MSCLAINNCIIHKKYISQINNNYTQPTHTIIHEPTHLGLSKEYHVLLPGNINIICIDAYSPRSAISRFSKSHDHKYQCMGLFDEEKHELHVYTVIKDRIFFMRKHSKVPTLNMAYYILLGNVMSIHTYRTRFRNTMMIPKKQYDINRGIHYIRQ